MAFYAREGGVRALGAKKAPAAGNAAAPVVAISIGVSYPP